MTSFEEQENYSRMIELKFAAIEDGFKANDPIHQAKEMEAETTAALQYYQQTSTSVEELVEAERELLEDKAKPVREDRIVSGTKGKNPRRTVSNPKEAD